MFSCFATKLISIKGLVHVGKVHIWRVQLNFAATCQQNKPEVTNFWRYLFAGRYCARRFVCLRRTSEPAQPQSFFIMPPKRKPSKVEAESVEEKPKRVRAARNADKPTEAEAPDSSEVAENGASGDAPRARRGRAAKVEAPVEEKEPVKEKKIKKPAAKPKAAVKPEKAPAKAKATRGRPKADKAKEDDEEPDNEDKPQEEEPKAPAKKTKKAAAAESEDKPKKAKTEATPLLNNTDTNYDTVNFNCKRKNSKGELPNFKISTWNVGGLKAWMKKDGLKYITAEDPDIFCLQETKCSEDKLPDEVKIDGYKTYWLGSDKQGYAGVALYTKTEPLEVKYGLGVEEFDEEGRCITAEYEKFYLVNVYVPNAGRGLTTLPKRLSWNEAFKTFVKELDSKKPVIVCGDMNVAHNEIDIANPKTNKKNAGFTQEERDGLTDFLGDGYVDSYRALYPDTADVYTFWSYMSKARSKNIGWRLDYFIVSEGFMENVCDNVVRSEVFGSDHCPVVLFVNL